MYRRRRARNGSCSTAWRLTPGFMRLSSSGEGIAECGAFLRGRRYGPTPAPRPRRAGCPHGRLIGVPATARKDRARSGIKSLVVRIARGEALR